MEAEAQARQQRGVDAHLQAGQELLVADQQQAERRLRIAPVAGEQTHFLERGGAQVLRLVQHDRPEQRSAAAYPPPACSGRR